MKRLLNHWPYIVALLPQFIFVDYIWMVISTIIIGFIASRFISPGKVFGKIFILELLLFFILFLILKDRVFYLNDILRNLQIPGFLLFIILPLFNALNIAVLFFTGYKSGRLLPEKQNEQIAPQA